jgi:hypothetical protein
MRRRWLVGGLLAAGALLASATPASAHLRSGTVAVDYRATVLEPQTTAYTARIFQSDRALGLMVKRGHSVVLVGYVGEPVFRLDGAGLWVNAASPTAVVLRMVGKGESVGAPGPEWRLLRGKRSVVWHDARTQRLGPGINHGSWSVPLIVDGLRMRLTGELWRLPAPSIWPWIVSVFGLIAVCVALRRGGYDARGSLVLAAAAAAASVVVLVSFAIDSYASPGTWIEAIDAIAFLAVGIWALLRAPEQWRSAGAIGVGLVAVAVGLLEGAVFFHPIVLAVLPGAVVRFACVIAIGAGVGAAALGASVYARVGLPALGGEHEQEMPAVAARQGPVGGRS